MVWTYNPSLLTTSKRDAVRFLVGDVVACDPQMQDEEIDYALTLRASLYGVAAVCCRALQAKFSRSVDTQAGNMRSAFSQLARAYKLKALEYEQKAATSGAAGMPYCASVSISEKIKNDLDTDRKQPEFSIGMDDNYLPVPSAGKETEEMLPESGG